MKMPEYVLKIKAEMETLLDWLDDIFVNTLHVSKKTTERAGGTRRPLQAELAYLNKLGLVNSYNGRIDYRIGVGLSIDWPKVQNSILYFNNIVGCGMRMEGMVLTIGALGYVHVRTPE